MSAWRIYLKLLGCWAGEGWCFQGRSRWILSLHTCEVFKQKQWGIHSWIQDPCDSLIPQASGGDGLQIWWPGGLPAWGLCCPELPCQLLSLQRGWEDQSLQKGKWEINGLCSGTQRAFLKQKKEAQVVSGPEHFGKQLSYCFGAAVFHLTPTKPRSLPVGKCNSFPIYREFFPLVF